MSSIGPLAAATQSPSGRNPDVIVVGAGYAGLAAALRLRDRGLAVTVLEARDRVGGRAWSIALANGEMAELGGEWIFEGYDELRALAARFALALAPMGIDFARRTAADVDAPLAAQDGLAERLRARAASLAPGELDTMSLGAFVAGEDPSPALAALVARWQGTCAVDLSDAALRTAFDEGLLRPGGVGASWRVADGNQALAEAMARALDVRLGALVTGVVDGGEVARVTLPGAPDAEAAAVVLAVPLPVLRSLAIEPALPTAVRRVVDDLRFGDASKLALAVEEPLAPRARQSVAGPFWWWVSLHPSGERRRAVTAYAGSPDAHAELGLGDGPTVWVERLLALDPEIRPFGPPAFAHWGSDALAGGAYAAIPPGVAAALGALEAPIGRVVLAGEHTAGAAWHGTLEGALRSGARAADQVAAIVARG